MGKHSGWPQGRRRTRQQLENAAVDVWICTTGHSRFFKLSRDFTHAKARKRMVWQQRVRSLTPAEFKRTYRMTLKTFCSVLRNIRPAIMSSFASRKKARRDLGGAVAAELRLSMTLRSVIWREDLTSTFIKCTASPRLHSSRTFPLYAALFRTRILCSSPSTTQKDW